MTASTGAAPLLVGEQISHEFIGPDGRTVEVLRDVTIALAPGEFVAIVGPSGSGKTTLLRILGGLIRPTEGRVLFDGRPITRPPADIGFAFQQPTLLPWRSVLENVILPMEVRGATRSEAEA